MTAGSLLLTYHSLDPSGSILSTAPHVFRDQMQALADSGRPVLPLDQAVRQPGTIALTFDDGYANFLDHALPVLTRHRLPATIFVVTGQCGQPSRWPGAPGFPLMSWDDLGRLPAHSIALGGHTISHANLARLKEEQAQVEIKGCCMAIAENTGVAPVSFAYPYGASNPLVRRIAAGQFALLCGTQLAAVPTPADPADLPRIEMFYYRDLRRFRDLIAGRGQFYLALRQSLRWVRTRLAG